ncbi:caspase recruitment domain-containing protein 11 isoform X2 [Hippocampus zosterae]|uniref:caspase recruitment domain-containing protein 11 isoform X2 n=1 Tax=Hippocampus zosterae TaxID=109293 RepID=UPI00223E8C04|nr:caspase recruitment domain-containing protein 11 isoform X2 [Hippocampus zosterae]
MEIGTPGILDDVELRWENVECRRYEICRIISPAKLTPYLRQCKVLDEQDEDEILNSLLLVSKANRTSRLLDILRSRGERGYVVFLESLEFYYPELYKQVTGKNPTRRFSTIVVEEGHEGLTQFLMNEVMKLQEQSKVKTLQHAELSRKNCTLEDEQKKLRLVNQELQTSQQRFNKMKEERNSYSDELLRVKDENYKLAMRYAALSEEKNLAVMRSRDLQLEIDQFKHRLNKMEEECKMERKQSLKLKNDIENRPKKEQIFELKRENETLKIKLQELQSIIQNAQPGPLSTSDKDILDILEHDRQEALEDRQDLVNRLYNLHEEVRQAEELRDKYLEEKEDLELKCSTLQKDCQMYRNRMDTITMQLKEVEKERDQAFRARDDAQHQFSQSLIDKDKYRKQIRELEEKSDELQIEMVRKEAQLVTLESRMRRISKDIALDQSLPKDIHTTILFQRELKSCQGQSEWSSDESPEERILPEESRLRRRPNLKAANRAKSPSWQPKDLPISVEPSHPGANGGDHLENLIPSIQANSNSLPPSPSVAPASLAYAHSLTPALTLSSPSTPRCHSMMEQPNRLNMMRNRTDSIQSTQPEPPEKASLYRRERENENDFQPRSLSDFDSDTMECEEGMKRGPSSVHSSSSSHQSEVMDTYDMEQVNNIFRKFSLEKPFRPSLSSLPSISSVLKPVQEFTLLGENLLKDIALVGGNDSGIFISSVQPGSVAEKTGLREGHRLLLLEGRIRGENPRMPLETSTQEEAFWVLKHCSGLIRLHCRANFDSYRRFQRDVEEGTRVSGDSFYIRVNLNISSQLDFCSLSVQCDEVVHVLDTKHQGQCEWLCARVDPYSGCDLLERGTLPSNSRAQQLLLVKIQKLMCRGSKEENEMQRNMRPEEGSPCSDPKTSPRMSRASIFLTQILQLVGRADTKYKRLNSHERVRIITTGSTTLPGQGFDTLRVEDAADPEREISKSLNLTPYSHVTPQRTERRRPVLIAPAALAKALSQKLVNMVGAMDFSVCKPDILSKEESNQKLGAESFVYCKEKGASFEFITKESIEAVAAKGKHCLLQADLSCVKNLLRVKIYPIIIVVKICEKNVKKLRKLPLRLESEEEFLRSSRAKEKELEGIPCLYTSLEPEAWLGTDDLIRVVKERIFEEQKKTVWVERDLL